MNFLNQTVCGKIYKHYIDEDGNEETNYIGEYVEKVEDFPDSVHEYVLIEKDDDIIKSPWYWEPYYYPKATYQYACHLFDLDGNPISVGNPIFDWIKSHI